MKKLALLIAFMLIFVFTSFAQIDVTVEGSSELTLGIALSDPVASGITNTNTSKISFTLATGSSEKGAEEDVYGMISISGWGASANSDDEYGDIAGGDVTAKIITPSMWVMISGTNSSLNFINPVQDDDGDDDNTDEGISPSVSNSGGIVVGLAAGPANIEIGLFSENDWTQDDEGTAASTTYGWDDNDDNEATAPIWGPITTDAVDPVDDLNNDHAYGASLKVNMAVAAFTIDVAAVMGLNYVADTPISFGAKISGDLAPLTIYAGADIQIPSAGDMLLEAGAGLTVALADGLSAAADVSYNDIDLVGDDLDVRLSITEDGAGGVVPGIGAGVTVELFQLMQTDIVWNLDVTADYTTDTMKGYVGLGVGSDDVMNLNVGVELYVITNVTFVIDYSNDDLNLDGSNGLVKFVTKIAY